MRACHWSSSLEALVGMQHRVDRRPRLIGLLDWHVMTRRFFRGSPPLVVDMSCRDVAVSQLLLASSQKSRSLLWTVLVPMTAPP